MKEQRRQSRLWPFINIKCIFQGGQQMAQRLWSLREGERVKIRAERGRERDLFVSFVFLVEWSPSVVWLWERTRGKCSLTAGVRLLLDKIICGGEEVALFCVCACVCMHFLLSVCFFSLNVCLKCSVTLFSFGTQCNTEVVFDLHTVLHMLTLRRRKTEKQWESSCSEP